jgi:hypothetical protein
MVILGLALAAFLTTTTTTTKEEAPKPPVPVATPLTISGGPALAKAIKSDIENIAGPGSVDISIDHETLFSVRVAVPGFRTELCTRIYDRVVELYHQYPDLNFDFYLRPKARKSQAKTLTPQ